MASINSGRKLIQRSTTTARSLLTRISSSSSSSAATGGSCPKFTQPLPTNPSSRLFTQKKSPFSSSRVPVELSCAAESLMPFHSATASALLNSMLSSKVGKWGVLSEGFATPL